MTEPPEPPTTELLAPLARALEAQGPLADDLLDDLSTTWTTGQATALASALPADALAAVKKLSDSLAALARSNLEPNLDRDLFEGAKGAVVLAWAEAAASRRDVVLAPLLTEALRALQPPSRLIRAARARVAHGTLHDGLACLPLAGDPAWLLDPEKDHQRARARTELLILEAASSAMAMPALGAWLFATPAVFDRLIADKSRGTLRDRMLAASFLAIAADGYPAQGHNGRGGTRDLGTIVGPGEAPSLLHGPSRMSPASPRAGAVGRIVRMLASHPEPVVWIPATIALGRLASRHTDARGVLFLWLHGEAIGERRRAITALSAMTGREAWSLDDTLAAIITGSTDPWELAAIGPAIPFLAVEHRELFEHFLSRLRRDDAPTEALWSASRGLLALAKRGPIDRVTTAMLHAIRERALAADTKAATEAQLWSDVRRRTDFLDGIDPDPSDPELLLERAASSAVELGSDRIAPRAEAIARSIGPIFDSAFERAKSSADAKARASALAALDSSTRAAAIALWEPILGEGEISAELDGVRARMLDRASIALGPSAGDFALSRALLRALGLMIDAPGAEKKSVRAGRVLSAIDHIARDSEKLDARDIARLKKPIADALWRVVDATRPESIVLPDNVVYSRFAAWCALSAESDLLLASLPRSEAAARGAGAQSIADTVAAIRKALEERKFDRAIADLDALGFGDTALTESVAALGVAIDTANRARANRDASQLALALIGLSEAASQLSALISDPARALSLTAEDAGWPTDQYRDLAAETVQALGNQTIKPEPLAARWTMGLGRVLGRLVGSTVLSLLTVKTERSGSYRPPSKIDQYLLLERLGRGAQGEAWLVEHERTARRFVMKLLPERALTTRTPTQRAELERAIGYEGDILKTIYHPNVANFVDYGFFENRAYLVLEYLVGCDLGDYAEARPLTIEELKPIVQDVSAGVAAIASFGLVHGDLKPGNIFLRLALDARDMRFDPARDRDPARTALLGAVVIDLGVARNLTTGAAGKDVSGTPGYLAPEQANGRAHPKTDVYSLAATVYRTLSGRTFFSHLTELGARVFAHASRQPFDDPAHLQALPPLSLEAIALLKESTAMNPDARPDVLTFARRFQAL